MTTCSNCNGTGCFVCDNCNGTGVIGVGDDKEKCNGCNGVGSIVCRQCNGTGSEDGVRSEGIDNALAPRASWEWRSLVPGCVAAADGIIGGHYLNKIRTCQMVVNAILSGATMDDIAGALREYLESKSMSSGHVENQIARLRELRF
jgi:hypothetical protein